MDKIYAITAFPNIEENTIVQFMICEYIKTKYYIHVLAIRTNM